MAEQVAVIGAGAMGAALALAFERAQNSVVICGTALDAEIVTAVQNGRVHPSLQLSIPSSIRIVDSTSWDIPIQGAGIVALAVASQGVRQTVREASTLLHPQAVWAIGSKGWDPDTAEPLSKVVAEGSPDHPVVIVVGPSLAGELAAGTPTALVCASADTEAARKVAGALGSPTVRAFVSDDLAGVEVGAALKNVLAIGIGMCDGIAEVKRRPMTNTKAALFSRGLVEMGHLAKALGGHQETIIGLAGAGDLFVTVLGGRNGRFGRLVGTGLPPQKALDEMGTTVEGYENTASAIVLADRHGLDLPIIRMVHSVLYKGVAPEAAVSRIMVGAVEREL